MMQKPQRATSDAAFAFVTSPKKMLIDNQWVDSVTQKTLDVINPATEEVMCQVALAAPEDIDRAVAAAKAAFEGPWGALSPHERSKYLFKAADLIEQHADELAEIQSYDMGMVLSHSKALTLMQAETFRYYGGWITKVMGHTAPSDGSIFTYTRREPLGVVGAIIPWNGPILAASWKIAPAIAFGNTIVLKASEDAPLVPLRLGELLVEAGLPAGVVNIVAGVGSDAGKHLVEHPDVAKIAFTGSTAVGKSILVSSAASLKKVTLELGGKSPTIIFPDANMERAIQAAVMGFVAGTGQVCVGGTRILAHESIFEEVKKSIAGALGQLKVGLPFDSETMVAPLAFKRHYARVCDYIDTGKKEGATLVTGGESADDKGLYVKPALFADVSPEMRIYQEEIFGPVAVIVPFKDEEDAIRIANNTNYGLAGSVHTSNLATAHRVAAGVKSGTIWVNTTLELDSKVPFGGYKQSGIGREHGHESIDAYTQVKTVMVRF